MAVAPQTVAAGRSMSDLAQMIQIALNRFVANTRDDPTAGERAQWLLTQADQPPPRAFVLSCPLGPYQLLRRSGGLAAAQATASRH